MQDKNVGLADTMIARDDMAAKARQELEASGVTVAS